MYVLFCMLFLVFNFIFFKETSTSVSEDLLSLILIVVYYCLLTYVIYIFLF